VVFSTSLRKDIRYSGNVVHISSAGAFPPSEILKEYEWFSVQDCVIHTRDVARLSESVKILEPQASVFLRFPKVEQHPKCTDHAILLGKPFGNCFIK
jgi:hypothetical protein